MTTTETRPAGTPDAAGGAAGYRPGATLAIAAEWRRQASRRRTQLALGFMVLLPLVILVAFQFEGSGDDDNGGGEFGSLIELATTGGLNFTLFSLLVSSSFLLVVVVALFCGDTVASEASWGSLRYLLAVPVPRARLLTVKLVVALAYSLLALLLIAGTAMLAGTLRYGWEPLSSTVAAQIPAGEGLLRLLGILGYLAVVLLVVAGLAFLLSVTTDAALGAVGGAVLLWILSSILDQITALGVLRDFLPTHYSQAWLGLLSTPVQTDDIVKGAISAICYATVFWSLAFWRFTRKDVVS
ncbi:ABC transporter permease subunit [Plantactinospora sp. S1510]|uniref:ABC transporter permease subunit n=1 Tax=Plantactinospora alkalitolerans TaxID=2789879 RepID=A0ABS0GSF8_9ACTN|nr:ABC transporter permease subunit [Plantactinospora alkalitolerans]MBF9129120.1 ABC transporter permease subunit [Plantactinospora alkalitolerans]